MICVGLTFRAKPFRHSRPKFRTVFVREFSLEGRASGVGNKFKLGAGGAARVFRGTFGYGKGTLKYGYYLTIYSFE